MFIVFHKNTCWYDWRHSLVREKKIMFNILVCQNISFKNTLFTIIYLLNSKLKWEVPFTIFLLEIWGFLTRFKISGYCSLSSEEDRRVFVKPSLCVLLFYFCTWLLIFISSCPSQVNGGIENTLEKEVVRYDYYSSYFDIFVSILCCTSHFGHDETNQKANSQ